MAHLRDSYGGTSRPGEVSGPAHLGCLPLKRTRTKRLSTASLQSCRVPQSAERDGGRMAPSLLVCYTLAKTVVLFTGRVQGRCTRASPLVSQLLDP